MQSGDKPSADSLCKKCNRFFGSPQFNNFCSKCYQEDLARILGYKPEEKKVAAEPVKPAEEVKEKIEPEKPKQVRLSKFILT